MFNADIIKETVYYVMPPEMVDQIIIFGSSARGDVTVDSDTDICIITHKKLSYDESKRYRGQMNRIFAFKHRMATDILLKSSDEYARYREVIGAIENEIMRDGVAV